MGGGGGFTLITDFEIAVDQQTRARDRTFNWLSYEQNTLSPYMGISTNFDKFWPINWANRNIIE